MDDYQALYDTGRKARFDGLAAMYAIRAAADDLAKRAERGETITAEHLQNIAAEANIAIRKIRG